MATNACARCGNVWSACEYPCTDTGRFVVAGGSHNTHTFFPLHRRKLPSMRRPAGGGFEPTTGPFFLRHRFCPFCWSSNGHHARWCQRPLRVALDRKTNE